MAPNRSRLLVFTLGLLLAIAALAQVVGGDSSDLVEDGTVSSSSLNDQPSSTSNKASTSPKPASSAETTVTTIPWLPPTSVLSPRPVSFNPIADGATRITGYGSNVVDMVGRWSDYRTIIYRSSNPGTELLIELRNNEQTPIFSLGHSDWNAPVEGLRFLNEVTQDVAEIAITAIADWEIDLLPEAFLWNQQIDSGHLPLPGEFMIFSSTGLNFVGSTENPMTRGIGDLSVYNACHSPCTGDPTIWVFEFAEACSHTPTLSIREADSDLFERTVSPTETGSGKDSVEVRLQSYEWLQVLTPCRWSAEPIAN